MFRELSSRQLALNIIERLNRIKLIQTDSENPPLFEITALLNVNHSLLSWACGKGKPSTPTIKHIIEIILSCPESDLRTEISNLVKQFFNIWKIEVKYHNPYLEELINKC